MKGVDTYNHATSMHFHHPLDVTFTTNWVVAKEGGSILTDK